MNNYFFIKTSIFALCAFIFLACNQGYQVHGPGVAINNLSEITTAGSHDLSGSCSPDGASIVINCGGADSIEVTCQQGSFTANNVEVTTVPASCTATIDDDVLSSSVTQTAEAASVGIRIIDADYIGPDNTGNWQIDFDLSDPQGLALEANGNNHVRLSLFDLSNQQNVLFAGDFLIGDDLSTATPSHAQGLDFATFVQPFISGTLSQDQNVIFAKKSWAQANARFYQITDASPKQAIQLGIKIQINDDPATQIAPLPIYSQFSYDNHSIPSAAVTFPHTFSSVLSFGGVLSAQTGSVFDFSTAVNQCGGAYRTLPNAFDTILSYVLDGQTVASGYTALSGDAFEAVAGALGTTSSFISISGTSCQDRLLKYHLFNDYLAGQNLHVIADNGSGQELMRFKLVAFRSF